MDIRYSNLPNQIGGLWGIRVKPGSLEHVEFISNRDATQRDFKTFYHMIFNF
jgi:inner membrane protein